MKKISTLALVKIMAGLLLVAALAAGTAYAASSVAHNGLLDQQEAEDFVLMDADVKAEEVSSLRTRLEKQDGVYVYDIEFYVGSTEYEYEIRAEDGMILEKEKDDISQKVEADTAAGRTDEADPKGDPGNGELTSETADYNEETASGTQARTGGDNTSENQARTGGDITSETQARTGGDTSSETQARTGGDTSSETQARNGGNTPQPAKEQPGQSSDSSPSVTTTAVDKEEPAADQKYISVDRAKQIALEDAGLKAEDVKFTAAKFEDDKSRKEYDIEFYFGNLEYEYEIDAMTGRILDSEVEKDNDH